jgi:transposase
LGHCRPQRLRSAFSSPSPADGKKIALGVVESLPSCPIHWDRQLSRTLRTSKDQLLAYFTTDRTNNGRTEALNGSIELHYRTARGSRNPYL